MRHVALSLALFACVDAGADTQTVGYQVDRAWLEARSKNAPPVPTTRLANRAVESLEQESLTQAVVQPIPLTPLSAGNDEDAAAAERLPLQPESNEGGREPIAPMPRESATSDADSTGAKVANAPSSHYALAQPGASGDDLVLEAATAPTLLTNTTDSPWATVHKLLVEFRSSESGSFHYYSCSAFGAGSFHLLTAGACVYNHDPDGNGSTADRAWATRIWAWAAQTDQLEPFGVADHPYGVAQAVFMRSYTGWTNNQEFEQNWAVITLDRRQGDHAGWMGRASAPIASSLNFTGYAVETPFVPAGALGQYRGFDFGNVTSFTDTQVFMNALIYGGHSGGPVWRFSDGVNTANAIISTSDRRGSAVQTRLTTGKLQDLINWIDEDESARPPIARPNLIEYWFPSATKDVFPTAIDPGEEITVTYNILNVGFAEASDTVLDFYLSGDDFIASSDFFIGSVNLGRIRAFRFSSGTARFNVPFSTPPGTYKVGWIARTTSIEYNTNDNAVVISAKEVSVGLSASCPSDPFEPDGSAASAKVLLANSSQSRSICPTGDNDWLRFSVPSESAVLIETSGAFADTRLWLYNSGLAQLDFDDDSGSSLFSRIQRRCGIDSLPAGDYFLQVDEFGDNNEIPEYFISLGVTPCASEPAAIRAAPLRLDFSAPAESSTTLTSQPSPIPVISSQAPSLASDFRLRLKNGSIDVSAMESPQLESVLKLGGPRHLLMQFDTLPDARRRRKLKAAGIDLLEYVAGSTFLVSVDRSRALSSAEAASGVRWAMVPTAELKMSKQLMTGNGEAGARNTDGTLRVRVGTYADVGLDDLRDSLAGLGPGVRLHRIANGHGLEVSLPAERLRDLAALDSVSWIEAPLAPRIRHNETAAQRLNVDVLRAPPDALAGNSVAVGIWDGGTVDTHADFAGRLTVVDSAIAGSHATHVAGTVAGSGSGRASARGMAPGARLYSWDWNSDLAELRGAASGNLVAISNHSYGRIAGWFFDSEQGSWVDYGAGGFGRYGSESTEIDNIVYDTDVLVFKSAGNDRNDGPDCASGGTRCDGDYLSIGHVGNSKNIVTVCALSDTDTMTSFSSWGPTLDGRVKPDLCANGSNLESTGLGNSYYRSSGTSMSSPSAAGASALLREFFVTRRAAQPSADLLKNLLIHGARDLAASGPDFSTGWGIIDAVASRELIAAGAFRQGSVGNGQVLEYALPHSGGALKATLVWTDPGASPSARQALVNDLDLLLIAPSGAVYRPYVLNGALPSQPASTGDNDIDNVEQVLVGDAQPGTWTARVVGDGVPIGPQKFSLVSAGLSSGDRANQSFAVFNDGGERLNVSGIAPSVDAPWIEVSPTEFGVEPGQSSLVNVYVNYGLAPTSLSSVRLQISSDDPSQPVLQGGIDIVLNALACPNADGDELCDADDPDDDNDGYLDQDELANGTSPTDADDVPPDSDGDLVSDLLDLDDDNDGYSDIEEIDLGSDPRDAGDVPGASGLPVYLMIQESCRRSPAGCG
ncbi:MAG: S8 family serine peptidase [Pseudomonadota bacterium]